MAALALMFNNRQQRVPELFREIIRNDNERTALRAPKVITMADARSYAELQSEKREFRLSAEVMLRWNPTDENAGRR